MTERSLADVWQSLVDLHNKIDRLAIRSECVIRAHDGGVCGHSYTFCKTHPAGTPHCKLTATATDKWGSTND